MDTLFDLTWFIIYALLFWLSLALVFIGIGLVQSWLDRRARYAKLKQSLLQHAVKEADKLLWE